MDQLRMRDAIEQQDRIMDGVDLSLLRYEAQLILGCRIDLRGQLEMNRTIPPASCVIGCPDIRGCTPARRRRHSDMECRKPANCWQRGILGRGKTHGFD